MYAQQGLFEGSILTNATIQADVLRAKKIIGTEAAGEESPAALDIYDPDVGIRFWKSKTLEDPTSDDSNLVCEIASDGMTLNTYLTGQSGIYGVRNTAINGNLITINNFKETTDKKNYLNINPQSIGFYYCNEPSDDYSFFIDSENNIPNFSINSYSEEKLSIKKESNELINFTDKVEIETITHFNNNYVVLDDDSHPIVSYERVKDLNNNYKGLDIYVVDMSV